MFATSNIIIKYNDKFVNTKVKKNDKNDKKIFTNRNVYSIMEKKIGGGEKMKITLKALRVNSGYTIEKASESLGISTVTLRSYETKKTIPNMEMLNKMLKLYDAKFSKFEYSAKDNALVLN
jgi:toxin-antitoxin system, antitoxin component, xre family